jgi:hypothetical protein
MYHRFSNIIIGGDLKNRYSSGCKRMKRARNKSRQNRIHRFVNVDILKALNIIRRRKKWSC